ncbi:hypothetical protein [Salipaludibacillus daqingensis]|uniref:hypothetical protein n=1 Tax=Salipaludibacillus daqingensis TaxID=3041001 RepID=UPI002475C402|nr:hypothetical protein [Salipaludibacillus daqingensis]
MKKGFIVGIVVLLLTAIGGTVLASESNGDWNFEDRLSFMQDRHPDLTDEELEKRFNECTIRHEEGEFGPGMMRGGMMGQGKGMGMGQGNGPGNGFGPNNGQGNGFGPGSDQENDK